MTTVVRGSRKNREGEGDGIGVGKRKIGWVRKGERGEEERRERKASAESNRSLLIGDHGTEGDHRRDAAVVRKGCSLRGNPGVTSATTCTLLSSSSSSSASSSSSPLPPSVRNFYCWKCHYGMPLRRFRSPHPNLLPWLVYYSPGLTSCWLSVLSLLLLSHPFFNDPLVHSSPKHSMHSALQSRTDTGMRGFVPRIFGGALYRAGTLRTSWRAARCGVHPRFGTCCFLKLFLSQWAPDTENGVFFLNRQTRDGVSSQKYVFFYRGSRIWGVMQLGLMRLEVEVKFFARMWGGFWRLKPTVPWWATQSSVNMAVSDKACHTTAASGETVSATPTPTHGIASFGANLRRSHVHARSRLRSRLYEDMRGLMKLPIRNDAGVSFYFSFKRPFFILKIPFGFSKYRRKLWKPVFKMS